MNDPLILLSAKIPMSLADEIDQRAAESDQSRSAAIRDLLALALAMPRDQDSGYQAGRADGLRAGAAEAREAIKTALADLW